jgi:hypothetical protein
MKRNRMVIMIAMVFLLTASPVLAGSNPIEKAVEGCKQELTTYCKDVTPGQGRGLACLYAHGDKLSGKCEYALYDAAAQLERAVAALSYVVNECADDLGKLCQNVPAGQGRLLECINKNEAKVSSRCKGAIKEVGLK